MTFVARLKSYKNDELTHKQLQSLHTVFLKYPELELI